MTGKIPGAVREFIKSNVVGIGNRELTEMVNAEFGTDYKVPQVKSFKKANKLSSGLTGQFSPAHVPHNKGKKGICAAGCEKGWFKKGHVSTNSRPIGSERIDKDGYTMIKTAEPNVWKLKQKVIWKQHYGEIPNGYKVIFLDGNKENFDIRNLKLVSSHQLLIANQKKLLYNVPELTESALLVAELYEKKYTLQRRNT